MRDHAATKNRDYVLHVSCCFAPSISLSSPSPATISPFHFLAHMAVIIEGTHASHRLCTLEAVHYFVRIFVFQII